MGHEALEGEAFEIGFLSMMIEHHRGALEKSEWILERTERDELREAAEAIIASQEAEIETMTTWLRDWYDQEPDAEMVAMMAEENAMMMEAMMSAEEPEHAFLEMMIMHHQGAIDMAQPALTQALNEPLREMARDIVLEQAEEIYVFEGWRREWFGGELGGHEGH